MDEEEYVFYLFFWISILAAYIDRKYEEKTTKQIYGSAVGSIFILVLCRSQAVYPLTNVLVNCFIIAFCKRKCYVISLIFSLIYLYCVRKCTPSAFCNIIIMITTLRMIGVACEVNDSTKNENKSRIKFDELTFSDIFFYSTHYSGMLGAPYYTYATYDDYLKLPFRRYHNWKMFSVFKLVCSVTILSLYIIFDRIWPPSYILHDDFHMKHSILYRILYPYPLGYVFIFRIWHAFILFECSCCISGLGVYPSFTKPKCGYGPTENLEKMLALKTNAELEKQEYNFDTITNTDIVRFHTALGFGDGVKKWNTTVQYWLYSMVYKQIPYRGLKKPFTMLLSSYWHGLDFGYFAALFFSTLILMVDKRWQELLKGNKTFYVKLLLRWIKFHFIFNLLISFLLKERSLIFNYQKSVYFHSIIILILFYILLIFFEKKKRL